MDEKAVEKYQKKFNKWMKKGLKKGIIAEYSDTFFNELNRYYYKGIPLGVLLFMPEYCYRHPEVNQFATYGFDKSTLVTAYTNNRRVVYGKKFDGDLGKVQQYVLVNIDGEDWVVSADFGMFVKHSWFKKLENPLVIKTEECTGEVASEGTMWVEDKDYLFQENFPNHEEEINEMTPRILECLNSPTDNIQRYNIDRFELDRVFGEFREDYYTYLQNKKDKEAEEKKRELKDVREKGIDPILSSEKSLKKTYKKEKEEQLENLESKFGEGLNGEEIKKI